MANYNIQHRIALFGQPTNMTCWSAAITMLFGNLFSAGSGRASTTASGGLNPSFANVQALARSYNLRLHAPQSWTVPGLVALLQKGPVMMMGYLPSGHAVVLGGIVSDGSVNGTTLTIYDPWPPNVGKKYSVNYLQMMTKFPMATTYLLQR
jgi:hypothetical protein